MNPKRLRTIALVFITALCLHSSAPVYAYGEIPILTETSLYEETWSNPEFHSWQENWASSGSFHTGDVSLTPGADHSDLIFNWYGTTMGEPAVLLSTNSDFSNADTILASSTPIHRTNGSEHYCVSNQASVSGYFTKNQTYYYRVTDDYSAPVIHWSKTGTYHPQPSGSFQAIVVSDVQIGASGSIDVDTYNWNKTLSQAEKTAPNAAFLLSAGDQVNEKTNDDTIQRECEYAGLFSPPLLRRIPFAAAIGNHDTKVSDYKEHFHMPNTDGNYGATPAGGDSYFRYGNALFLVLNSNSRDKTSHRAFLKKATTKHADATWRIVLMHHDIYGSGAMHANRTSANLRTILAPLMDEFQIDLVLSGHDHSYSRSYPVLDGTAFVDSLNAQENPLGTTYISLGTSSGCKMYGLSSPKQYYVAERSNNTLPTYSVLQISDNLLSFDTYDYTGTRYADTFSIKKTGKQNNPLSFFTTIEKKKKETYTKKSYQKLQKELAAFQKSFQRTKKDAGAEKIASLFRKTNDPLTYYGYAAGTTSALPAGFSTLLDKTLYGNARITATKFTSLKKAVQTANANLKKTSLSVKIGKKKLKSKQKINIKKGKRVSLQVNNSPAKSKVTYSSSKRKYVTINKKGVITVKKHTKKPVKLTIRFENRTLTFYVKTQKK